MQNGHAPAAGARRKRPLQPEPGTPMWAERAPAEVMCDFCAYPFPDVRPRAANPGSAAMRCTPRAWPRLEASKRVERQHAL